METAPMTDLRPAQVAEAVDLLAELERPGQ